MSSCIMVQGDDTRAYELKQDDRGIAVFIYTFVAVAHLITRFCSVDWTLCERVTWLWF